MSVFSLRSALGALLVAVSAHVASAQQLWSPFVGLSSTPTGGPLSSGGSSFVLEPGARLESSRASLLAQWGTTFEQQTPRFDNANIDTRMLFTGGGRFETGLFAAGQYDRGFLAGGPSSNARVRLQFGSASPTAGLQFGAGADAWRLNTGGIVVPAATASGWIRRFGLSFSAEVNARALANQGAQGDTGTLIRNPESGQLVKEFSNPASELTRRMRTFGEGRLRVSGAFKSIGIDGEAGVTYATGGASRGFGSLILTRWLSSSFALTGGFVVQPPVPGAAERRGAVVGVRLARSQRLIPRLVNAPKAAIASCTVRYSDAGATVEIEAPGANHVELSGDFTRWQPVVLEHRSGDRWTLTTAITPGVHRLVVRVDGTAWMPPPGLPQAVDLYEGTVGILVAPEPVVTNQH